MNIPKEIYVVLCDEAPSTFHIDLEAAIKESNESPCPGADVWKFKWTGNKFEYDCLVYYYSSEHKKYVRGEVTDKYAGPKSYHHSIIYVEEGFNNGGCGGGFDSSVQGIASDEFLLREGAGGVGGGSDFLNPSKLGVGHNEYLERDEAGEGCLLTDYPQIRDLQSQLQRAQCEVTELQNTLKLERELRGKAEVALIEVSLLNDVNSDEALGIAKRYFQGLRAREVK